MTFPSLRQFLITFLRLKDHIESVHQKLKRYKCDQCPFESYRHLNIKRHVKRVHDKIREDSYMTSADGCL